MKSIDSDTTNENRHERPKNNPRDHDTITFPNKYLNFQTPIMMIARFFNAQTMQNYSGQLFETTFSQPSFVLLWFFANK